MNTTNPTHIASSVIARVKLVTLSPKECWNTIASEQHDPKTLVKNVIAPLVAAGALAQFLGLQIFGFAMPLLGTWRPPLVSSLIHFLLRAVVQVAMLFIAGFVVQKLSTTFQGSASREKAFSLVAHAALPGLAAGLLGIFPPLLAIGLILGIVGIYAFYSGISTMTAVPEGSRLMFVLSCVVVMIVLGFVVSAVEALLISSPWVPS